MCSNYSIAHPSSNLYLLMSVPVSFQFRCIKTPLPSSFWAYKVDNVLGNSDDHVNAIQVNEQLWGPNLARKDSSYNDCYREAFNLCSNNITNTEGYKVQFLH